jgi:hypothetical protein
VVLLSCILSSSPLTLHNVSRNMHDLLTFIIALLVASVKDYPTRDSLCQVVPFPTRVSSPSRSISHKDMRVGAVCVE